MCGIVWCGYWCVNVCCVGDSLVWVSVIEKLLCVLQFLVDMGQGLFAVCGGVGFGFG